MTRRRLTWLDVFTSTPLAGNGLAVVHDADGLSDEQMHRFARETKLSETSFVLQTSAGDADYHHRIFMMSGEIPFAGHPSLGTAVAVALARGEDGCTLRQRTQPGIQPIDVERAGDAVWRASMLQEPPVFGPELSYEDDIAPAVGIEPDGHVFLTPRVVSTGVPQVIAYVCKHVDLSALRPDHDRIGALLAAHDAVVLYVAQTDKGADTVRARSFLATAEMGEDPATGSAAGPLVADLADRRGQERVVITQGVDMGRPSELVAEMEGDRPRVGGEAVVVVEGEVRL